MHFESAEAVRKSVSKQWSALPDAEISYRSSVLIQRLLKTDPDLWRGKTVALYRSFKDEIQLAELETALLKQGVRICYPKILDDKSCEMCFESGSSRVSDIDIFVVPGMAFGRQGERIGRGKGFYDRFLALYPRAFRLALAFDFQLFPFLQQNSWDQRVHRIVTESEDMKVTS